MGDCFSTATIAQKKRGASRDSHLSISVGLSINPFATFRSASAYIPKDNWAPALNPDSACPYLPLCFVRGNSNTFPHLTPPGMRDHILVARRKALIWQSKCIHRVSTCTYNVLFPIYSVTDRATRIGTAQVHVPQWLACCRIECHK